MSLVTTRQLLKRRQNLSETVGSIQHFAIRNPMEAADLSRSISNSIPDSGGLTLGIGEMLLNAIEHGNLEIGFHEKTKLLEQEVYLDEIEERLNSSVYSDRHVDVFVETTDSCVICNVFDQGTGFNPTPYMELSDDRMLLPHGRGIALAKQSCFNFLEYNPQGNAVSCLYKFTCQHDSCADCRLSCPYAIN